jgi:hypothetical protein
MEAVRFKFESGPWFWSYKIGQFITENRCLAIFNSIFRTNMKSPGEKERCIFTLLLLS